MESLEERFESPEHLIAWADEEIAQLEGQLDAFRESNPYRFVREADPKTRKNTLKLKAIKSLPLSVRGRASNIIKNLRDALDQAVFAASAYITGNESNQTHFPFGESPDDLEKSLSERRAVPWHPA